jgi:hypothetical protein
VAYLESELRAHLSDAWVCGYESPIPRMTNHEKDRHVAAAAVCCEAPIIVTFNLRHFGPEHLGPWGIRALHPQSFLVELIREEHAAVIAKLEQQAAERGRSLNELLKILRSTVPEFVTYVVASGKSRE